MSIATLKRKTMNGNPRMSPISGSNNSPLGFALNGTRRITGVVGETNLGPSAYHKNHKLSCCSEDTSTIKPSVMNTKGMLSVRYNKCQSNCQKPIVQETVKTQNEHIQKLHILSHKNEKSILQTICGNIYLDENKFKCHNNCKNQFIGGKNTFKGAYTKNSPGAISESEYIKGRYLNKNAFLLGNSCKPHFPHRVNNNGCNIYYKTLDDINKSCFK